MAMAVMVIVLLLAMCYIHIDASLMSIYCEYVCTSSTLHSHGTASRHSTNASLPAAILYRGPPYSYLVEIETHGLVSAAKKAV